MLDKPQKEDHLDNFDYQSQKLKEKITTLKELITTMVEEEKETKHQSELLVEMLRVLRAVKEFEAETLNAFTAHDSSSRSNPSKK